MKHIKSIFLIVLIALTTISWAQKDSINRFDSKGQKHGIWFKTENGKTIYEGQFNHGFPYGKFTYYHDDGKKVKNVSEFFSNGKISKSIFYHENGKIISKGKFVDKVKDSIWVYFSDNGTLVAEENYKLGKKNGIWKTYDYETGKIIEEVNWKNDLKNGISKKYFTDGKPRYEITYIKDKAIGKYSVYYPGGQLLENGVYRNSVKDSISTIWSIDGKIIRKIYYQKGFVNKDYIWVWNDTGKKEIFIDSVSYLYRTLRNFAIINKNGTKVIGKGNWDYYFNTFNDLGFMRFGTDVLGSINSVKKVVKLDDGTYQVFFKHDLEMDIFLNEEEIGYLKSLRPKLFVNK